MRTPTPWLRKQNQTWYVQLEGRQINLGKNKKEAFAEYLKLMHLGVPKSDQTVRQVLDAYWNWAKSNLAEETCNSRKAALTTFGESVPKALKAADVRAYHVQKWIDDNKRIKSSTTVNDRITLVKGVMNWAMSMGYIESNPIAEMPKPSRVIRQDFLPADTWQKVLDLATDREFREFLSVMLLTGVRVQEMFKFEAKHLDEARFVLPIPMSKGRKRSRVVYLPPEALEIVKRLIELNPDGKLFRNRQGNPWNRNSIRCRFRRMKRELNMPNLTATTLRHSYAHHRLTSGQDALTVAKLMGHVDTRMIATRYGHLEANSDYMQDAANQIGFPGLPVVAPDLPGSVPDQQV
jgi:integrase/recombinase XerD